MSTALPDISIVIPAFNEESYLRPTIAAVQEAIRCLDGPTVEIIVVDNGSQDRTSDLARSLGAKVTDEPRRNVAFARNAGARAALGQILVFLDADTHWPEMLLCQIFAVMSDNSCIGGAVDTEYRPKKWIISAYMGIPDGAAWDEVQRGPCRTKTGCGSRVF